MISDMRQKAVADLSVATSVYDRWPDNFQPPGVMVLTPRSGNYITRGQLVGEYEINLDVLVVVKRGATSQAELTTLDELVEVVLYNTSDWAFRGVDSPALVNINGAQYPATIIHICKQDKLF